MPGFFYKKKREEQWRQASRSGPPGAVAGINPLALGGKAWQAERDRRRREVRMKYGSDRKKLVGRRRQAERELREDLRRQRDKVERYYGRKEGRLGAERAQHRIREKYRQTEREMSRKFDRTWLAKEHDLARSRDRQYREITKSMKRESRQARGLADRAQLPWN